MSGSVSGLPKHLLRLEGLGVLGLAVFAYMRFGSGWPLFLILFLTPDLSMLGYLFGKRLGAVSYNLGHSYLGPIALIAYGAAGQVPLGLSLGLIWAAHIGFDRMLGYGLKYAEGFKYTHLNTAAQG